MYITNFKEREENPVELAESRNTTNWNLDSDRGYGYKTWSGKIPSSGGDVVGDETYI